MAYATVKDVSSGFRKLTDTEEMKCEYLIDEASSIVDAVAPGAREKLKKIVVCRMIRRALGDGNIAQAPIGSAQGSVSALGYSQTWSAPSGASFGELYLGKTERSILGLGRKIGMTNPYGLESEE